MPRTRGALQIGAAEVYSPVNNARTMATHASWQKLLGAWTGKSRLILPGEADRECATSTSCTTIANGSFLVIHYTWVYEGAPQDGQLMLTHSPDQPVVDAVFLDSWHMGHRFMPMSGRVDDDGKTIVNGTYQVPGHPDWGWRIVLDPSAGDSWVLQMFNVSPEGEAYLGVEASYARL